MCRSKCYCGPYWTPKGINCRLSGRFNPACKIHDMDYESHIYTKREADDRFLKHMIRIADRSDSWFRRMYWRGIAYNYYWAVKYGGDRSWVNDN